ncbi:oxidoreductase [Bacillus sp. SA1-12]|uniref:Gfo/Idh/MocA family protein n=1 Tax=Bacillus sp. SA1-12 TaxID=1455638 RepID=UPI00062714CD|nr:Gfo/Idh/MocA family oxidoreductase [Bacillus sp. SA1-12]KKI89334.1 oxidoreductase [Bacillus sp. SA1-12]
MTLKIGFIGTGGIAKAHLNNLMKIKEAEVTAFFDINLERAQKEALEWKNAKAYKDVNEMLDDQKLDAVYICVPPMAHGEAEIAVIERGIPFLVEKPLGIDQLPTDILKKIEQKKLITSVGYHWRYQEATRRAMDLLNDRKLGMALGYWMGGMPMVPWWRLQTGSGGQFVEQTTHIVDLLRYLCGEIVEVFAAYGHQVMHEKVEGTTVADVGTVTMKLANGSIATISNTCMSPVGHKVGLDIYTDQGVLEISSGGIKDIRQNSINEYKERISPYFVEDEVFINAILTGDSSKILSDYQDALITHEVTLAANKSAEIGKPINLKELSHI